MNLENIVQETKAFYCLECGKCSSQCLVARSEPGYSPRMIVESVLLGMSDYFREKPQISYSCNLCEYCHTICPQKVDVGKLCLMVREQLVAEGLGPLSQHQLVIRDQEFALSGSFALTLPDPKFAQCERVFFPGCNLSAYSPDLVTKTYEYLQSRFPGTGIILGCCGAPTHCLGLHSRFEEILGGLESEVRKLGASEVLLACPDCYRTIKRNAPGLKLKSVYETIAEEGLPEGAEAPAPKIFCVHDSCTARGEQALMNSIRTLVKQMGYQIEEMEYAGNMTHCCGAGGMVPYADFGLYSRLAKRRADEAPFDLLTYCAVCRETFASLGKESIHILELIFDPDWDMNLRKPPQMGRARRENQTRLRNLLSQVRC